MKNNIHKRGQVWYVRFRAYGRRHNISLGQRYSDAVIEAPKVIAQYRGTMRAGKQTGWKQFRIRYIAWKSETHRPGTIYRDNTSFNFLEEKFRPHEISEITPGMMDDFQAHLKNIGKSNVLTNRTIRSIKRAMRKAEEWELVKVQDWKKLKMMKEPSGKLKFYSVVECQKLLQKTKGKWKTIVYLGLRAGLRRGEIHSLRWEMVDFQQSMIRIEAFEDWVPKDYESRAIPMTTDLKAHLKGIARPKGFVLGDDRIDLGTMTNYFKRIAKSAKVGGSMHTLRHSFGAHLAIAGVSAPKIQKLMGHADLKTTQIYMHLSPESIKDSVDRLPSFETGTSGAQQVAKSC